MMIFVLFSLAIWVNAAFGKCPVKDLYTEWPLDGCFDQDFPCNTYSPINIKTNAVRNENITLHVTSPSNIIYTMQKTSTRVEIIPTKGQLESAAYVSEGFVYPRKYEFMQAVIFVSNKTTLSTINGRGTPIAVGIVYKNTNEADSNRDRYINLGIPVTPTIDCQNDKFLQFYTKLVQLIQPGDSVTGTADELFSWLDTSINGQIPGVYTFPGSIRLDNSNEQQFTTTEVLFPESYYPCIPLGLFISLRYTALNYDNGLKPVDTKCQPVVRAKALYIN